MRLLLVSAAHHPTHGGIGAAVWLFVERATRAGWHIELVTRESPVIPRCARVHAVHTWDMEPNFSKWIAPVRHIHRIRPYRYGLWSYAVAEKLLDIESSVDAIGFVDSQAQGYVALTSHRVRSHWQGVPMFVHAHTPMWLVEELAGMDSNQFGRSIYHKWERAAIHAASGVIAPSRRLLHMLNCSSATAVIPNVVVQHPPRTNAPQQLLLFVGNIEYNKGVDVWARSLNHVLALHQNATALMIGRDTATSPTGGSMVEYVHTLLSPNIRNRVRWCDALSHDDVQSWMRRAAAIVVPSRFESFSYVAAEAISNGVPLIVSDRVGITEYVPDVVRAPIEDESALADAQCEILRNPEAAATRAMRCREQLLAACDDEQILDKVSAFVRRLPGVNSELKGDTIDSMDEMRAFLASIEQQVGMNVSEDLRIHAAAEHL